MNAVDQNVVETLLDMIVAAVVEAPKADWPRHGVSYTLDPAAVAAADAFAEANGLTVGWTESWGDRYEDPNGIAGWFGSIAPGMDYTGTIGGEIVAQP